MRGHTRSDGLLEDYCDGAQFKHHPLFCKQPKSLQIMLYFDEVEVCNPLGSKVKTHKLGTVSLYTYVYIHICMYQSSGKIQTLKKFIAGVTQRKLNA